jgi:putative DNA primase/helicase
MQQLWAEVHALYQQGESWFLQPEEMAQLNQANEEFEVRDPIEDRISSRLDWSSDEQTWRWMTVTDLLIEIGVDRPLRSDINTAGQMVRKLNGNQGRKSNGVRQLKVPPQAWQGQ